MHVPRYRLKLARLTAYLLFLLRLCLPSPGERENNRTGHATRTTCSSYHRTGAIITLPEELHEKLVHHSLLDSLPLLLTAVRLFRSLLASNS